MFPLPESPTFIYDSCFGLPSCPPHVFIGQLPFTLDFSFTFCPHLPLPDFDLNKSSFDIMQLPWFNSSAQSNSETQSQLQTQFGHQRVLNEQTVDAVCAALPTNCMSLTFL
jgi:hypothetical protein